MEEKWINEGLLKRGEDVATQMGWRVYGRDYWRLK